MIELQNGRSGGSTVGTRFRFRILDFKGCQFFRWLDSFFFDKKQGRNGMGQKESEKESVQKESQ